MKIVDRAVKKVYRFNCPNCQSRLEGESKEFEDIGGKISKFFCPVCKKDRYIVTKIEPAMALSFYPRLDTVRRLP